MGEALGHRGGAPALRIHDLLHQARWASAPRTDTPKGGLTLAIPHVVNTNGVWSTRRMSWGESGCQRRWVMGRGVIDISR